MVYARTRSATLAAAEWVSTAAGMLAPSGGATGASATFGVDALLSTLPTGQRVPVPAVVQLAERCADSGVRVIVVAASDRDKGDVCSVIRSIGWTCPLAVVGTTARDPGGAEIRSAADRLGPVLLNVSTDWGALTDTRRIVVSRAPTELALSGADAPVLFRPRQSDVAAVALKLPRTTQVGAGAGAGAGTGAASVCPLGVPVPCTLRPGDRDWVAAALTPTLPRRRLEAHA